MHPIFTLQKPKNFKTYSDVPVTKSSANIFTNLTYTDISHTVTFIISVLFIFAVLFALLKIAKHTNVGRRHLFSLKLFFIPISLLFTVFLFTSFAVITYRLNGNNQTYAATNVNVTVDTTKPLSTISNTAFGINSVMWDTYMVTPATSDLTKAIGAQVYRFPGGSMSDGYHWQQNTTSGSYIAPGNTFDSFMTSVKNAGGQALVTTNYMTGSAAEAASWVDYANNTKHYGVKYWEIGNEVYADGTYPGWSWEGKRADGSGPAWYATKVSEYIDAMKAKDPTIKVGAVLLATGEWPDGVSPDWNKTVMSMVGNKIDFVIVHWYAQGPGNENDANLLRSTSEITTIMNGLNSLISQYKGTNPNRIQTFVTEMNSVSSNPGKQTVSLVNALFIADAFTTFIEKGTDNIDLWAIHGGESLHNNNSSLLYGDLNFGDYGLSSVQNCWPDTCPAEVPAPNTPFPSYNGYKMLTYLGKSGDQTVQTSSDNPLISVHAVKQSNGSLAILVINKDPNASYPVSISLNGYSPNITGSVYMYGKGSNSITQTTISNVSSPFVYTAAPYSLSTIVLSTNGIPPTPTMAPTHTPTPILTQIPNTPTPIPTTIPTPSIAQYLTSSLVSPTIQSTGKNVTITTTVKTNINKTLLVDIELYDQNGAKVFQNFYDNQSFIANESKQYIDTWTIGSTALAGTYTVKLGLFNPSWNGFLYWNDSAAKISVISAPTNTPKPTNTPVPTPTIAVVSANTISIFAQGQIGNGVYPTMKLSIQDPNTKSWLTAKTWTNVGSTLTEYTYVSSTPVTANRIRVYFTNDYSGSGGDRNLRIDKIVLNGITYQSEASTVYSVGSWTPSNGCGGGYKQSEWLHCNGYFQY